MENQDPNQNQNFERQFSQQFGQPPLQQTLPNSSGILVMGIISLVFSLFFFCYLFPAIVSIILGAIALSMSSSAQKMYNVNPQAYTPSSYNNMKAGKICAIIGLSISGAVIVIVLFVLIFWGAMVGSMFGGAFDSY
jgi:hypothetical protein